MEGASKKRASAMVEQNSKRSPGMEIIMICQLITDQTIARLYCAVQEEYSTVHWKIGMSVLLVAPP